jgi:hypothetical protein
MKLLLIPALLVAGLRSQEKVPQDNFVHGSWHSWSDLGVGSWVTHELQEGDRKSRMTTTLTKKDAGQITLQEVVEAGGVKQPVRERVVSRPKGAGGVYDTAGVGECPACKKSSKVHKKMEYTEAKEKLKISGREVVADTNETVTFDCDEKESSRQKFGYSDDVPGGVVLIEKKSKESRTRLACVGFEKK